jgi:hypothetical protein
LTENQYGVSGAGELSPDFGEYFESGAVAALPL